MNAQREYFNPALGRWVVYLGDGTQQYRYRWLMEQHLGRKLDRNEHVHHVNGDSTDDRLENLMVLSASDHLKLHAPETSARARAIRGDRWAREHDQCGECSTVERSHFALGLCKRCYYRLRQRKVRGHGPRQPATVIDLTCEQCGCEFQRTLKQGRRRFCSLPCASRWNALRRWERWHEERSAA